MPPPPVLVFDLDGTLVDSAYDLTATLNRILIREGLRPIAVAEARGLMGHGAKALLTRGFELNGASLAAERLEHLFQAFLADYEGRLADESRPFPGAVEALGRFAADGWLLAVCTNKLAYLAEALLTALSLRGRFAAIGGADSYGVRKPDPGHLLGTIRAAGGDPADAVMVGDSAPDIETAKAAGVPVIAVDFGYSAIPVRALGPDAVISHFDALDEAVRRVRRERSRRLTSPGTAS